MEWLLPERIWLSENVTWRQVASSKTYPQPGIVYYAIPIGAVFVVIRSLLTRFIFIPFGESYGLKSNPVKPVQPQSVLENAFKQQKTTQQDIQKLAAEVRWTVRDVEVWFRQKKIMNRFTKMTKFTESAWRFVYYFSASVCEFVLFWNEPWLLDWSTFYAKSSLETVVTPTMRWFYIVQLGFGVSLLMRQLYDVRRKDFRMMFIHHLYYLFLVTISWITNSVQIGIVILIIHDVTDVPLEATKCTIYLKKKTMQSVCFVVFALLWIVFRLMLFPLVIYTYIKNGYPYVSMVPYIILILLLLGLQFLHIIWSKMIFDIFLNSLKTKELSDVRSDSEDASSSDEAKNKKN